MSQELPPELAQKVATYIKDTDELIQELKAENAQLKIAASGCDKCGCNPCKCEGRNKEASEGVMEGARITEVVDHLVQAGFLKESSREQAVVSITEKPATALLDFVDKLAAQRIVPTSQVQTLGKPVEKPTKADYRSPDKEKRASDTAFEATFDNLNASR